MTRDGKADLPAAAHLATTPPVPTVSSSGVAERGRARGGMSPGGRRGRYHVLRRCCDRLDRETTITWFGHAVVEVKTPGGKTIVFDPWYGNPKSPKAAAAVTACDLLLVTHGHGDHFGDALAIASRLRPARPAH